MWTIPFIILTFLLLSGGFERSHADQLQPLIEDLRSTDIDTRMNAIKSLGESGDIRAIPPLLIVAYQEHELTRQYAIEALQNLARVLDDIHVVVKRWLQSLIDTLRSGPGEDRITVMHLGTEGRIAIASAVTEELVAGERACV